MGAEGTHHVHVLHDRDILMRTAICEACGPVTIVRKGGFWRCREGFNARNRARNARNRGNYEYARQILTAYLVQHGLPDAEKPPEFIGLTAAQAEWLYWVARAGINAIAERHKETST